MTRFRHGRTDGQTDGVTAPLDLLSPSATQVKKWQGIELHDGGKGWLFIYLKKAGVNAVHFQISKYMLWSIPIFKGDWVSCGFLNVAATVTRLQICRLLLSPYILLAGSFRALKYHVTCICCVGFGGVIWWTALFNRLVQQARDTKEKLLLHHSMAEILSTRFETLINQSINSDPLPGLTR